MKIVIPGGTGHIGSVLVPELLAGGHDVVVLSRSGTSPARVVKWDGRTLGDWANEIDGSDAVINLAGRSVNCRYTQKNLQEMMDSRIDSTRAVGLAIGQAKKPPRLWLQMSTATIYAHRFDAPNDEANGIIGGSEPDAPESWLSSIEIAKGWEKTLFDAKTPQTRRVALRTAMMMSPESGGTFDMLLGLTRRGLGGAIAGGNQFMSWIHYRDLVRAIELLLDRDDMQGVVNLAAPNPLPQREFMSELRRAWGAWIGLPAAKWMLEIGTWFMGTESELILKSRRVVPKRLLDAGFSFEFPEWSAASKDLVARWKVLRDKT